MIKPKDKNRLWYVLRSTNNQESRLGYADSDMVLEFVNGKRQNGMTYSEAERHAMSQKSQFPDTQYFLVKAMYEVRPATGFYMAETDPR